MINPDNIFHVLPIDDIDTHIEKCDFPVFGNPICRCKCMPEHREVENDGLLIIHNAFDGREIFENAKNLLDNTN